MPRSLCQTVISAYAAGHRLIRDRPSAYFVHFGEKRKAAGGATFIELLALCQMAGKEELPGQTMKCVVHYSLLSGSVGAMGVVDCAGRREERGLRGMSSQRLVLNRLLSCAFGAKMQDDFGLLCFFA